MVYRVKRCFDCGVGLGEVHIEGCDIEACSVCNSQRLSCSCSGHKPELMTWQGIFASGRPRIKERGKYNVKTAMQDLDSLH